ncbi:MAG: single-stranded-DNA-specific exonuclease RecJ [Candidatus Omnitrophica bacterium]|nr:single-stranded-DNA-specific exonuclease RecJ [Candidatus Omnitrophota bacterium]
MKKIWNVKEDSSPLAHTIAHTLGVSDILGQLLINRGIGDVIEAEQFLSPSLSHLHNPHLLNDIDQACELIQAAISRRENVLVWGDYDVDGVSSCALLITGLNRAGARVSFHIPRRVEDGYGLNEDCVAVARQHNARLFISVDCGITSHREVAQLKEAGIKVIITDHHRPAETLPLADAVVDPWRKDSSYPFRDLAGVGVAFKLIQAFFDEDAELLREFLDLVALGTVCDVVPLVGENRILVSEGLKVINSAPRTGIRALARVGGIASKRITTTHIGFILGPRINASGRIGSADESCRLLLTDNPDEAARLSTKLDRINRSRQQVGNRILKEALTQIEDKTNFKHEKVIVIYDEGWHPGVIGIVASRIAERFFRPTIIVSTQGQSGKGSGRSIPNFHLFEALERCSEHLVEYGGHKHAVGLTIAKENLREFRQAINRVATEMITVDDLVPKIDVDLVVSLSDVTTDLIMECEKLSPFGVQNPQPLFLIPRLSLKRPTRSLGANGVALWVTDGRHYVEALDFSGEVVRAFDFDGAGHFDILGYPSLNEWGGTTSITVKLKDMRAAARPLNPPFAPFHP